MSARPQVLGRIEAPTHGELVLKVNAFQRNRALVEGARIATREAIWKPRIVALEVKKAGS